MMIKIKNLKKTALAMAIMATMFNHCDVFAAESDKNPLSHFARLKGGFATTT